MLAFVAVSIVGVVERAVAARVKAGVGLDGCGRSQWGYRRR